MAFRSRSLKWQRRSRVATHLLLIFSICASLDANAQASRPRFENLDLRLLRSIHETENAVLTRALSISDRISYPVMYATAPAAWAMSAIDDWSGDYGPAWRMTLAATGAYLSTIALKNVIRRERPYKSVPGITPRGSTSRLSGLSRFAMPSGHASVTTALAVSIALSWPEWYVIGPAAIITSGIALSRIWRGVHFPSDVLVGSLLGGAFAVLVHELGDSLTPAFARRPIHSIHFER